MIERERRLDWLNKANSIVLDIKNFTALPVAKGIIKKNNNSFFKFDFWEKEKLNGNESFVFDKYKEIILDFGEHVTGYFQFDLKLTGSSMGGPLRLKLIFGEIADELVIPFKKYKGTLSPAWLQDEIITLEYLPETVKLKRRFAFRYVRIILDAVSFDYEVSIENIKCTCVTSADTDIKKYVSASLNKTLEKIEEAGLRTLRNTMLNTFIDGPKRDKRLWLGDFPLQAKTNYYTFKNYDIVKRCLYLFASQIRDDGKMPACLYTKPHVHHGAEYIVDFAIMFGTYLLEYAGASGDWETAEDLFPASLQQARIVTSYINKKGIFINKDNLWVFIDWSPELNKEAAMHAVIIYSLKNLILLSSKINKSFETEFLKELIDKMITAAKTKYYDPGTNLFFSKKNEGIFWTTQVWMALAGVVDTKTNRKILTRILTGKNVNQPVTPFIYHYTLEALFLTNMQDEAVKLLKKYWGGMIRKGATTFWEVYKNNSPFFSPYNDYLINSYCHSWSCTPPYFIKKYLQNFEPKE